VKNDEKMKKLKKIPSAHKNNGYQGRFFYDVRFFYSSNKK